jgi:hypothetical protein
MIVYLELLGMLRGFLEKLTVSEHPSHTSDSNSGDLENTAPG